MKSERRHELQHNVLADWMAGSLQSLKPYQNAIFAAVMLVVVLVAAYGWWSRDAAERTTQAWDELGAAVDSGNATLMQKVIDDRPGTAVAEMAAVVEGDQHLAVGCEQLFLNKATAQQELVKAVDSYTSVRGNTRLPSLQERATYGLARAKEAKGDADDLKQALDLYEEVAKLPSGAFVAAAGQRADDLKRQSTKLLYDRFALFDPKPAFSPGQGERPSMDMNSLPKDGPIMLQGVPGATSKPDAKPAEQTAPTETTAPAETKPADEKMPAEASKPAEEKKASEEPAK